jgi:hypothetical protein
MTLLAGVDIAGTKCAVSVGRDADGAIEVLARPWPGI